MAKGIGLGVFVLLVIGSVIGYAYLQHLGTAGGDPNFFESDILDFEAADRASPPEPGAIVFVGSSSIRLWTSLAEDFAPLPVLNRGFGGAHFEHVVHNAWRIVTPYAPRAVAVYVGDNDLAEGTGKDADRVLADYREFVRIVHEDAPKAAIYFLSIKPSRLRWDRWPVMSAANATIAKLAESDPRLHYVDLATPLLGADGVPRNDFFRLDGLHLNESGYAAWTNVLRPILIESFGEAAG